jgi:hypothetical protein
MHALDCLTKTCRFFGPSVPQVAIGHFFQWLVMAIPKLAGYSSAFWPLNGLRSLGKIKVRNIVFRACGDMRDTHTRVVVLYVSLDTNKSFSIVSWNT